MVRHRRITKADTPEASTESCSRRDAVIYRRGTSPKTPARPTWRSFSSRLNSTVLSSPAWAKITRSECSPAPASAGAGLVAGTEAPHHGAVDAGQHAGND